MAGTAQDAGALGIVVHDALGRQVFASELRKTGVGATETFEWLLDLLPKDVETNQRLATLYQRLAKVRPNPDEYLAKSNVAIQRVIESPEPSSWDAAEAYALKARNIKVRNGVPENRRVIGDSESFQWRSWNQKYGS